MRLIDADEAKTKTNGTFLETVSYVALGEEINRVFEQIVDATPTIEAIPVEWIKEWIEDNRANHQVIWMLDAYLHPEMDWRKENATD